VELRYPYIPFQYTYTKGLFLKGTVLGEFKTAIGVLEILLPKTLTSSINMEASIKILRRPRYFITKQQTDIKRLWRYNIPSYLYIPS
jgi:hypothetical protein